MYTTRKVIIADYERKRTEVRTKYPRILDCGSMLEAEIFSTA